MPAGRPAAGPAEHHRGDLCTDHMGERPRGGGASVRLGRQQHRRLHPSETGELLSESTHSLLTVCLCVETTPESDVLPRQIHK